MYNIGAMNVLNKIGQSSMINAWVEVGTVLPTLMVVDLCWAEMLSMRTSGSCAYSRTMPMIGGIMRENSTSSALSHTQEYKLST